MRWLRALTVVLGVLLASCSSETPTQPSPAPAPAPAPAPVAVTVTALVLNPTNVVGGQAAEGTVTLSGAAAAGGTIVALSSSVAAARVPTSVTVPEGVTAATFAIATTQVSASVDAVISASAGGQGRTGTLQVMAPAVPILQAIEVDASVVSGQQAHGTVRLNVAAPAAGVTIGLRADDTTVIVPASIQVPSGALSATFVMSTREIDVEIPVHVIASIGTETKFATIRLTPRPLPSIPTLFSFTSATGDYIGRGMTRSFDSRSGFFTASSGCQGNTISIMVDTGNGNIWDIEMAAPGGAALSAQTYSGATRYPFQARNMPGLDVGGEARGCNQSFGQFTVTQAVFSPSGAVRRFRATFEQHCEQPNAPPLTGEISLSDPAVGFPPGCP